MYAWRWFL